ncbi:diheme cytochrome c [Rhodobacter ferrooxidans]|uniref:DHC, diheme cytochrome c n=2 Tax=Rhodobacter ferrooxidans TaxID=371731 RepID=C8S395_9RHOB|nr:diheme cytochrome c [Rhodobacter sp. SW2]EEW24577.1 DHC, diheme cytochrome c [Rhodobacter sp. SW2]
MSRLILALAATSALLFAPAVFADNDEGEGGEGGGWGAVQHAATQAECSGCHMVFPPQLLPPESWNAIMGDLKNHFGEDATVEAATAESIRGYLVANAMQMPGVDAANPPLRITEMRWFTHEHGKRLLAKAEANPKIGSLSNCVACHRGAASGMFDDD